MKKFGSLAAVATAATLAVIPAAVLAETTQPVREVTEAAAEPVQINAGMMLYSSAGYRVAPIYRVTADGSPQLILNGRLVTVPASSLSVVDGKVTTALTKSEIANAK
ncbi:hypothetical protein [Novosphingobium mangrovi (ex Huang et al. 2023)]|uniref:Uncharacterized protein n=1 Tax=Novosphingobium mangrovi (ex Huang et al. 2023) TaxID=2976432 RepID=A0ABT2I297_9SPHN|nr:hypothetical protein [Novosphingobium mangrovi (ex Huang et al. 2023)]MCT2398773.1 hypothetical protein [Novosphingobium mangrovi (ex Huang et al. 2023)]